MSITLSGRIGFPFPTCTGFKQQVSPLGSTLFGLILNELRWHLAVYCPATGLLSRAGTRVWDLQKADIVLLKDTSADGMQQLISSAQAFTQQSGLLISVDKTAILCCNDPACMHEQ